MRTDEAWKRWGEQEPYYGVCADPRFRRGAFAQHREEFFRSGEEHIEKRLDLIRRLYGEARRRTAVDFGSGTGRLVIPLSRRYERVIGVDISPAMTDEARKNCAERRAVNVAFCETPAGIPAISTEVDLVNSSMVLQHIPPRRGLVLLRQLLGTLAPEGVAALHVTVLRRRSLPKRMAYTLKHRVPGARLFFNILQRKRPSEPLMQMNNYPIEVLLEVFLGHGLTDLYLEPVFDSSLGFVVYGRKRGLSVRP